MKGSFSSDATNGGNFCLEPLISVNAMHLAKQPRSLYGTGCGSTSEKTEPKKVARERKLVG